MNKKLVKAMEKLAITFRNGESANLELIDGIIKDSDHEVSNKYLAEKAEIITENLKDKKFLLLKSFQYEDGICKQEIYIEKQKGEMYMLQTISTIKKYEMILFKVTAD